MRAWPRQASRDGRKAETTRERVRTEDGTGVRGSSLRGA